MSDGPSDTDASAPSQARRAWLFAERMLGLACAAVLLTMMFLTGADVIARYVLNSPIKGAFELTEVLLVLLVYLAMPLATRANTHVEVELWEPRSAIGNRVRKALAAICGLIVFGVLALRLSEHGTSLAEYGSVTNALGIPLSYVAYLAAFCSAVCVCAVILNFFRGNDDA